MYQTFRCSICDKTNNPEVGDYLRSPKGTKRFYLDYHREGNVCFVCKEEIDEVLKEYAYDEESEA